MVWLIVWLIVKHTPSSLQAGPGPIESSALINVVQQRSALFVAELRNYRQSRPCRNCTTLFSVTM